MPFANYKNFQECLTDQQKNKKKSPESARKICGYLQKKAEGQMTEEEYNKAMAELWIEDSVLHHGAT